MQALLASEVVQHDTIKSYLNSPANYMTIQCMNLHKHTHISHTIILCCIKNLQLNNLDTNHFCSVAETQHNHLPGCTYSWIVAHYYALSEAEHEVSSWPPRLTKVYPKWSSTVIWWSYGDTGGCLPRSECSKLPKTWSDSQFHQEIVQWTGWLYQVWSFI